MVAATRAVTPAARDRRLQLVDLYVEHLRALNVPSPFDEGEMATGIDGRSAFAWTDPVRRQA